MYIFGHEVASFFFYSLVFILAFLSELVVIVAGHLIGNPTARDRDSSRRVDV